MQHLNSVENVCRFVVAEDVDKSGESSRTFMVNKSETHHTNVLFQYNIAQAQNLSIFVLVWHIFVLEPNH